MELDVNICPGRLLELHDVMLSSAQDDARVHAAWWRTNSAYARRQREALREGWRAHHEHVQELHAGLEPKGYAIDRPPRPLESPPPLPKRIVRRRVVSQGGGG